MDVVRTEQFTALWTAAQPTLNAFIRTLVPEFQQAEEVLQRVAIAAFRKFDQYDETRPFAAWAVGVAKYEVMYFRRQRATERLVFDDELVEKVAQGFQEFVDEADPIHKALEVCLEELKGRPRKVIRWKYESELSAAAIGERLHISTGAVRILLWRARATLRDCIESRVGRSPAD